MHFQGEYSDMLLKMCVLVMENISDDRSKKYSLSKSLALQIIVNFFLKLQVLLYYIMFTFTAMFQAFRF